MVSSLFEPDISSVPLPETAAVSAQMLRRFLDHAVRTDCEPKRLVYRRLASALIHDLEFCGALTRSEARAWESQWGTAYRNRSGSRSAVYDFFEARRRKAEVLSGVSQTILSAADAHQ